LCGRARPIGGAAHGSSHPSRSHDPNRRAAACQLPHASTEIAAGQRTPGNEALARRSQVRADREENAANYKKNVEQLNRTRDTEIERALSSCRR
jgi:hypothetical protein